MRKQYPFSKHLKESLKDPAFRKAWEDQRAEYQLACQLIEKRLSSKMSQRQLANKARTTQAVICRIETMEANPSLLLLKKIASALGTKIQISLS
jgi:ribosome-binding protein aMBF1 (putative translation factor)